MYLDRVLSVSGSGCILITRRSVSEVRFSCISLYLDAFCTVSEGRLRTSQCIVMYLEAEIHAVFQNLPNAFYFPCISEGENDPNTSKYTQIHSNTSNTRGELKYPQGGIGVPPQGGR